MAGLGKDLPECMFGSLCYRTGEDHRRDYWHPEGLSKTGITHEDRSDPGSKDRQKDAIFLRPSLGCASNSTLIGGVGEKVGATVEGNSELDAYKGLKEIENNEILPVASILANAEPIKAFSTKRAHPGVLLLLIGVPGSGKSTFCSKLMSNAAQPWTRICQDIIAKGKKGTKKECVNHAERALCRKHCVVIDRCNIDKVQRLEFLQLAASFGVDAHAVVLNLPASVCIHRASKRVGHEGGVGGGNAGPVITRFARTLQQPSLSEGFSRIAVCRTDTEIENVLQQYRKLLPSNPLESGVFGAAVSKSKNSLQLAVEKGNNQQFKGDISVSRDQKVEKGKDSQEEAHRGGRRKSAQMQEALSPFRSESSSTIDLASGVGVEDQGSSTLAFPSISTLNFHFDQERASSVLVEAVAEFLLMAENAKMRLVLVDLTNSHMLSLVSKKAKETGVDAHRFSTFVGDITKLRSSGGPACNVIANAANWRLKAGGGGVNAAIYSAAGPGLDRATKEVAQTLNPGTSVAVQLPDTSPLYMKEGVTHVIHVLGPNMNPQRPNCLSGDYSEGCKILHSAYSGLFQNFSSIVRFSHVPEVRNKNIVHIDGMHQKATKNAFTVLMQASKRNRDGKDANFKRDKVRVTEEIAGRSGRVTENEVYSPKQDLTHPSGPGKLKLPNQLNSNYDGMSKGPSPSPNPVGQTEKVDTENEERLTGATDDNQGAAKNVKRWDGWALALHKKAMHPEQHKECLLQVTDDAVVLRDAYPKAKKHMLVVARRQGLDSLDDLQKEHLPVLWHMHTLGREWAASFLKEDPSLSFRLGYHLVLSASLVVVFFLLPYFCEVHVVAWKACEINAMNSPFVLLLSSHGNPCFQYNIL